jgi:glucosylceramidase
MKINRRNFLAASSAALLAHNRLPSVLASQSELSAFSPTQKQLTVYTTADKTDYRISPTDTVSFKAVGQPKETQV